MKTKLGILLFSFLSLFALSNTVFATSGACSSHGGVNCSLSNSYKSVICNDGNSDGLTQYSDLQECKTVTTCDNGQVTAFSASRGLSGSSFSQSASSNCESTNITPTASYNLPVSNIDASVDMNKYCVSKHGYNSKYNYSKDACGCKDGYLFDENKICVPNKEVLKAIFQDYLVSNLDKLYIYNDVLEVDTIVDMASKTENYNKTFKQLIIEAYGDKINLPEIIHESSVKEVVTPKSIKIDTYQKPLSSKVISPEPTSTTPSKSLKSASNSPEVPIVESKPEVRETSFLGAITGKAVTGLQNLLVSFKNIFSRNK